MENASKALLLAGGILISVMVIGISMFILSSARSVAYNANKEAEESAIESFNRYYQSFGDSGCEISGIDYLNIYNKVIDQNERAKTSTSIREIAITHDGSLANLQSEAGVVFMQPSYKYKLIYSKDPLGYINSIDLSSW